MINLKLHSFSIKLVIISDILITCKGEPLLNFGVVLEVLDNFKEFPLELQTNGISLINNLNYIDRLKMKGLNILSFSLDDISDFEKFEEVFNSCKLNNLIIKVNFNVLDSCKESFEDFILLCKNHKIDQLTFRKISIPTKIENDYNSFITSSWIFNNVKNTEYDRIIAQADNYIKDNDCFLIRRMKTKMFIYDVDGISFFYPSYDDPEIEDLIYMDDGHLYTSWNSKASLKF